MNALSGPTDDVPVHGWDGGKPTGRRNFLGKVLWPHTSFGAKKSWFNSRYPDQFIREKCYGCILVLEASGESSILSSLTIYVERSYLPD